MNTQELIKLTKDIAKRETGRGASPGVVDWCVDVIRTLEHSHDER